LSPAAQDVYSAPAKAGLGLEMKNARPSFLYFLACATLLLAEPVLADKTDSVTLVNGNDITGEIKSLDFGALSYSTDSMGTVTIDWEDVTAVTSQQNLQVEITDGTRFFGKLVPADVRHIGVETASGVVTHSTEAIVRITPIESEARFIERLEGSFSLGFQTQKSSEVTTSNVAADISYRARRYLVGLRLTSTVTDQPSEETTARQSLQLNYQRFRANRWFSEWFTGWEHNDELGLQARTSGGAAWGRYFVQTNRNEFSVTGGAQLAREVYYGEDPSDTVAEGRVEVRYLHRNVAPDVSLNLTSTLYPLLSDLSNFRAETDLAFRREFIDDIFLEISVGHSYTSDPPSGGAKSDYAVTTSLGYDF
jgi:hypothetical protein